VQVSQNLLQKSLRTVPAWYFVYPFWRGNFIFIRFLVYPPDFQTLLSNFGKKHLVPPSTKLLKWFLTEYPKHSKQKLDMGKSCVRFKKFDEIPFKLIADLMKKMSAEEWIEMYENNLVPKSKKKTTNR